MIQNTLAYHMFQQPKMGGNSILIVGLCAVLSTVTALNLSGSWSTVADITRRDVQDNARFAAEEISSRSNSVYASRLMNVVSAKTQIVSGVKYQITLTIGVLDCMRREQKNLELCNVRKIQNCSVTVWEQKWQDFRKLTDFSCQHLDNNVENKLRLPKFSLGSEEPVNASNTQVIVAVNFVATHLSSTSNGVYHVDFHRLVAGTKQVVAGLYYRLKIELVLSSCQKKSDHTPLLKECRDSPQKSVIECDVEVIDQAWNVPRHTLKKHKCHPLAESENTLYFRANNLNQHLIGGEHDVGSKDVFESFKQKYGRQYNSVEEEAKRYAIFISNMKTAKQIQAFDQGTATYGASQFADMTPEEFRNVYLPRPWDLSYDDRLKPAEIPQDTPAVEFDWRLHDAVTDVKNQGSCGSCWAFSVTGNIEGQWAIKKKQLVPLSEQELVDCDKIDEGCNGGLPSNAYQEIQRLGGLETEAEYPYKGDDEKCNFVSQAVRVYINGSLNISSDEEQMKAWIYKNGPTSIGINAFAMQFYLGGISHPWKIFCAPDFLDHGVLIVGYGVKHGWFNDTPYWIIKNSWGPDWGEKGYYLVFRGAGVCGLNTMVSSALIN